MSKCLDDSLDNTESAERVGRTISTERIVY